MNKHQEKLRDELYPMDSEVKYDSRAVNAAISRQHGHKREGYNAAMEQVEPLVEALHKAKLSCQLDPRMFKIVTEALAKFKGDPDAVA